MSIESHTKRSVLNGLEYVHMPIRIGRANNRLVERDLANGILLWLIIAKRTADNYQVWSIADCTCGPLIRRTSTIAPRCLTSSCQNASPPWAISLKVSPCYLFPFLPLEKNIVALLIDFPGDSPCPVPVTQFIQTLMKMTLNHPNVHKLGEDMGI